MLQLVYESRGMDMKIVRGLLSFIISFVLLVLILGLTVTAALKNVVQNQLVKEVAKQVIISQTDNEDNISYDVMDKLFSYKETNEIIDSSLADYINYSNGTISGVSDETLDLIIEFCVKYKTDLENITKEEIDLKNVQSQEARENLSKSINEVLGKVTIEANSPVTNVVTAYETIISDNFKLGILSVIAFLVVLLALINWSPYKWMRPLGSVLITSGILVSILYGIMCVVYSMVKQSIDMDINVDTSVILISGICEFVSGIFLLIIYSIINKKCNKKKINSTMVEEIDDDNEEKSIKNNEEKNISSIDSEINESLNKEENNEIIENEDDKIQEDEETEIL